MKSMSIFFLSSLIAFASSIPIGDDSYNPKITRNDLFHQLNAILKREILKETKNSSLEAGDTFDSDDGKVNLNIQKFSSVQGGFPLVFKPRDQEILEDKEIITLNKDSDGTETLDGFFEIKKKDSSEEDSNEERVESDDGNDDDDDDDSDDSDEETATTSAKKTSVTKKVVIDVTKSTEATSTTPSSTTLSPKVSNDAAVTYPKALNSSTTESTTNKHEKLLKDIAEEPVLLTHI